MEKKALRYGWTDGKEGSGTVEIFVDESQISREMNKFNRVNKC